MQEKELLINKRNVFRQRPQFICCGLNQALTVTAPHEHEYVEVHLIKSGSGNITVGMDSYPFKKGDLIIYDHGTTHQERSDDNVITEAYFAAFDSIKIAGLPPKKILKTLDFEIIPSGEFNPLLAAYFEMLSFETEAKQPFYEAITEQLTSILLMILLRLSSFNSNLTFARNINYIKAKEYFDKHFTTITNIDDVCKSLYINKFYLSHIFKEQLGIPPVKYLIQKRIALAKNLLETTELNIYEIAIKCGYVDPAYFNRVFKSGTDITPLQYRFNIKQENKKK